MAARKDATKPAYDTLLDIYEKDLTITALDPFFETLRASLTPLILTVAEYPQPDVPFMSAHYPKWQ